MAPDLSNTLGLQEQDASGAPEAALAAPARSGTVALLALGSNLGDRRAMLREGARRLAADDDLVVEAASALYASAPLDAAGGEFLNVVIRIRTTLEAGEVLRRAKAIERDLGRVGSRGDARPLDIDVLYFGNVASITADLVVPHPRRLERPFVLVPLLDVCGTVTEPGTGRTVADSVVALADAGRGSVRRVEGPSWMGGIARDEEG